MLIFSVSFQFYRMRRVLPRSGGYMYCFVFHTGDTKALTEAKRISQREARTLNLAVNSRTRCQLRHLGKDNIIWDYNSTKSPYMLEPEKIN